MKRILSFFIVALCSASLMYAQVTLTKATHGFTSDDRHESVAVSYQEPGEGGQHLFWDYSEVELPELQQSFYKSLIEDNKAESNIVANRSDDVSFLFNITDKGNEYVGYDSPYQKLILSEPMQKTLYPQSYGTYFEGTFSGEMINKSNEKSTPVSGANSTHADATGTLILPGGDTFEVLRVHTTERMEYNNVAYVTNKYLWYAQDVKYPLFVTFDSHVENSDGKIYSSSKKSYVNINRAPAGPTQLKAVNNNVACTVSPNPFINTVEMSYFLPEATQVSIDLYTINGSKVTTLLANEIQSGNVNFAKDISAYTRSGEVYILKLTFGDKAQSVKLIKK